MSHGDHNSWIWISGAGTAYKKPAYEIHLCAICSSARCGDRRLVVANFKDYELSLHQFTVTVQQNVLSMYNVWQYDFRLKLKVKDGGNWWIVNCLSDHMHMQYVSCLLIWNSKTVFGRFISLVYPFDLLVMKCTFCLFKFDDVL